MEEFKLSGFEGYTDYEKIDWDKWDEYDYRKTQYLDDLKKCLRITNGYGVWQDFWKYLNVEIAELYYENGICCECDGDKKKIYYTREGI